MNKIVFSFAAGLFLLVSCQSNSNKKESATTTAVAPEPAKAVPVEKVMADAATILARKEVPILCYHHIQEIGPHDSDYKKAYTVTPANFADQMKALSDKGYHTILPVQLKEYLAYGTPLPAKPVMLTFDDTDGEQYTIGATEMKKYGFKGVFFIMTVSINRPRYMTKEQIVELSNNGNDIEAHTWDHHMVTKYTGDDWELQLVKPKKKLEDLVGKPVKYFAYPFGLWNQAAIPELKSRGYELAFILSSKRDTIDPLYTIRRMLVTGTWSTDGMIRAMDSTFK
jgi:peptidoglycan/xylan/chitin deacetylase (PgdA/CDA1 family)